MAPRARRQPRRRAGCHRPPRNENLSTPPTDAIVDTGAELSWLPRELLTGIGVVPRRRRTFRTASGQVVTRDVGYAIVAAEGFETTDEIVFAESGDLILLGVRTIEGFGVLVDDVAHRLVPRPTFAVAAAWRPPVEDPRASIVW